MLEQVVRPFVSPGSLATGRIVVSRSSPRATTNVEFVFGAAGAMPTPTRDTGIGINVANCDNTNKEKQDQTVRTRKRIENPDDPDQYVIVEDIETITFAKTPDDVENSFGQTFQAFAKSIADAINAPFATSRFIQNCNEKFQYTSNLN